MGKHKASKGSWVLSLFLSLSIVALGLLGLVIGVGIAILRP